MDEDMTWLDYDGTIAFGISATGELLELHRLSKGRGWRIVAHVDPKDGSPMIECHWDATSAKTTLHMFRDFLGIRPKPRRTTWMHPAQGEEGQCDG